MRKYLTVILWLLFAYPVWAATYYVDPAGSDLVTCLLATNPATPKQTIQNACACLTVAGDILQLTAGTHTVAAVIDTDDLPASGSAGNYVTIQGMGRTTTIVQPAAGEKISITFNPYQRDYIRFKDFSLDLTNTTSAGIYFQECDNFMVDNVEIYNGQCYDTGHITMDHASDNGTIQNCNIHDPTNESAVAIRGIYLVGSGHTVQYNTIDMSTYTNDVYTSCIQMYDVTGASTGLTIRWNNLVTHSGDAYPILINSGYNYSAVKIYSNTGRGGGFAGFYFNALTDSWIYNNSLLGTTGTGIYLNGAGVTNVLCKNNAVYGYADQFDGSGGTGSTTAAQWATQDLPEGTDPTWVDAANGDFHLIVGSPCIDAGSDQSAIISAVDYYSVTRSGTWDYGAAEYVPPGTSAVRRASMFLAIP